MKIILFARGLWNRAGIERMTVVLANALCEYHEVTIALIEPFDRERCPYELHDKVRVVSFNSYFKGFNLKNIAVLRKVTEQIMPDVVITVATPLVRISNPALWGMKIRNIAWEHFNLYAGSKIGAYWKLLSTRLVEKTIVLCKDDEDNFNRRGASGVMMIPNFSDMHKNQPTDFKNKIALAVGRHADQKGFDLLLKAWAKADVQDWKLKIVGSGVLMQQNIRMASELGVSDSVVFMESTSDIVSEYQNASCFILSSRYEGFGLVLIEARLLGLPVISFDCPTGPREIIRDGVDGFLVENGNIDALAKKIKEVLAMDNLSTYGVAAREDAINRFGYENVIKQWLDLIEVK